MLLETDANSSDLEFYEILQQKSLTLQQRTADIIRLLRVDEKTVNQDIWQALQYFQVTDGHLEKVTLLVFLSEKEQKAINLVDQKFLIRITKTCFFRKSPKVLNQAK